MEKLNINETSTESNKNKNEFQKEKADSKIELSKLIQKKDDKGGSLGKIALVDK